MSGRPKSGSFHDDVSPVECPVVIRLASDADLPRLRDLSELDSSSPLAGPILIAIVDEEVWAALALEDGRSLADPFRPSAAAVTLLRVRSEQLRSRAPDAFPRLQRTPPGMPPMSLRVRSRGLGARR